MHQQLQTSVKICGLRDALSVETALAGGADHIGFIFFPKSPRNVSPDLARELAKPIRGKASCVAVSVDPDDEFLDEIVKTMQPDMLQLHGSETPQRVSEIKQRYALPVMKAFAIRQASDFRAAQDYYNIAGRLLFDAKAPAGSDLPGGNGLAFDWKLFANWQEQYNQYRGNAERNDQTVKSRAPMLSGGINLNNIDQALGSSNAMAIDISSGVEKAPGVKDPALISALLKRVRKIENVRQVS